MSLQRAAGGAVATVAMGSWSSRQVSILTGGVPPYGPPAAAGGRRRRGRLRRGDEGQGGIPGFNDWL